MKKNRLVWPWNPLLQLSSTLGSSARWPERNEFLKPIQKKIIISIGYPVTVPGGYVKFIFKILDFYNVQLYAFANLLTWQPLAKKIIFW